MSTLTNQQVTETVETMKKNCAVKVKDRDQVALVGRWLDALGDEIIRMLEGTKAA